MQGTTRSEAHRLTWRTWLVALIPRQVTVASRMRRFHIMGGECNYLLRVTADASKRLEFVPEEQWKSAAMMSWSEEAIQSMLSSAEAVLKETAHRLRLPITVWAMHCRSCPEECSCLRQCPHHIQDGAHRLNEDEGPGSGLVIALLHK
jgi:hypothetical protein